MSPLFVESALQILEPSWGAPNDILSPTAAALGFVIIVNAFFALASLASLTNPGLNGILIWLQAS
jgi:hypothetical protein